jgi:hypothetical protein
MANEQIARVAFYFSAHQDDWQLFMNPPAFADALDDTCRCVFVHMTAGDAGLGIGTGGRQHPLYLAREHGAEVAVRFMADANERQPTQAEIVTQDLDGRPVRTMAYRNTVPAVDGSATYHGWDALHAALRALIERERQTAPSIDLHIPEADPALNLNDHSDHVMTALAVRDAWRGQPARWHHHVGYASGSRPENLGQTDRDMKCAVYAVTLAGVLAFDHQISWQHYDGMFIGRHYCRIEDQPLGAIAN